MAEFTDDAWAFYTTDSHGSTRQIVDESGEVVFYQAYEQYGDVDQNHGKAPGFDFD